jgi:hypothetical protein
MKEHIGWVIAALMVQIPNMSNSVLIMLNDTFVGVFVTMGIVRL